MDDFRLFPSDKRQIINFANVMSLSGTKLFICIDKGVLEIMRYLLNTRGSWRTTYRTSYVGKIGYNIPTEEEFNDLLNLIGEANIDMASCNDINESLQGIIGAINDLGASGASGCGCIGDPGSDIGDFNDGPGSDVPGPNGDPPPGFSTIGEYQDYKCDAVNWIFDKYVGTLRNWAALAGTVGGLTLAVIAGLLLLTVPPAGLALILSALGILVGIDFLLLGELNNIADELETNKDDIICAMYNAGTTNQIAQELRNAAAAAVQTLSLEPTETWLLITSNLISTDQADVALNKSDEVDGYGGDCSGCGSPQIVQIVPYNGVSATAITGEFLVGQTTVVESGLSPNVLGPNQKTSISLNGGGFDRVLEIVDVDAPSVTVLRLNIDGATFDDRAPSEWVGFTSEAEAWHFVNISNGTGEDLAEFTIIAIATNP